MSERDSPDLNETAFLIVNEATDAGERAVIELDDGEGNRLHATWSRSGKRLLLSVHPRGRWDEGGQVSLDHASTESLRAFIEETLRP